MHNSQSCRYVLVSANISIHLHVLGSHLLQGLVDGARLLGMRSMCEAQQCCMACNSM